MPKPSEQVDTSRLSEAYRRRLTGEPDPVNAMPLADLTYIARQAGVGKGTVCSWVRGAEDYPLPVAYLNCGKIWWWPEVQEWLLATGRRADCDLPYDVVVSNGPRAVDLRRFARTSQTVSRT